MTWRRLIAAVVVFFGVFVALAWSVSPLVTDRLAPYKEVEALKGEYLLKKGMAVNLDEYRQQARELDELFGATLIELPDKHERDFAGVRSAANARGLRVEVLVPAQQGKDWLREFTVETPARLVVTGRYHQLGAFLADLGRQPRSMRVNHFVIERSSQPGMVTMKGVVSIHRYLSDEEAAVERKRSETKK